MSLKISFIVYCKIQPSKTKNAANHNLTYKSEQFDTTITAMLNLKVFTRLQQNTISQNHRESIIKGIFHLGTRLMSVKEKKKINFKVHEVLLPLQLPLLKFA